MIAQPACCISMFHTHTGRVDNEGCRLRFNLGTMISDMLGWFSLAHYVSEKARFAARKIEKCSYFLFVWCMATIAAAQHTEEILVQSDSFLNGDSIPVRFTCDGEGLSPQLSWSRIPAGARSLVLSVEDPDAPRGTWNHWYVYNLPPSVHGLPVGASNKRLLPAGSVEALNDFKKQMYGGPCPPSGRHRYIFRVRALDTVLDLTTFDRADIERRLQGHVIAEGKLLGLYGPRRH